MNKAQKSKFIAKEKENEPTIFLWVSIFPEERINKREVK